MWPLRFYDLREVVRDVREGTFTAMEISARSETDIARGRAAIREMGSRIFSETEAGSWVLGPGVRR